MFLLVDMLSNFNNKFDKLKIQVYNHHNYKS